MKLSKSRLAQLATLPALPAGRFYLAVGPYTWGRGATSQEAVQNAAMDSSAVANGSTKLLVYDIEPRSYVDGMGSICYYPANPDKCLDPADPNRYRFLAALGGTKAWRDKVAADVEK